MTYLPWITDALVYGLGVGIVIRVFLSAMGS